MGIPFEANGKWVKDATFSFTTGFISLLGAFLSIYSFGFQDLILVSIATIYFFISIYQGVQYLKITDKDYIYFDYNEMYIYRTPFLSKKRISYAEIKHCNHTQRYDKEYIDICLQDNQEFSIHCDWLKTEDIQKLKTELSKATNNEHLFRQELPFTSEN